MAIVPPTDLSSTSATTTTAAEPRALHAALTARVPFRSRIGERAQSAADRSLSKWVTGEAKRPGLRTLDFVDRRIGPMMQTATAATAAATRMFGQTAAANGAAPRSTAPTSWLVPRPWFADEVKWMAAAGATTFADSPRALSTQHGAVMNYVAPSLIADSVEGDDGMFDAGPMAAWSPLHATMDLAPARVFAAAAAQAVTPSVTQSIAPRASFAKALRAMATRPMAQRPDANVARAAGAPTMVYPQPVFANLETPTRDGNEFFVREAQPSAPEPVRDAQQFARQLMAVAIEQGTAPSIAAMPPMMVPAGLGGVVAAVQAARAMHEVVATPTRVVQAARPAPVAAMPSIAAQPPAALEHVAWADRWLARMAGASSSTLASFVAPTRGAVPANDIVARTPLRTRTAAPAPVFVAPTETPATTDAAIAPAGRGSLRFDDGDATPDDIFHAVVARPPSRRAAPRAAAPAPVVDLGATVASFDRIADRIVRSAPMIVGAGLDAGLTAAPAAPALRNFVPAPSPRATTTFGAGTATVFDPRALSLTNLTPASFSDALVQRFAGRATFLALPSTDAAPMAANDDGTGALRQSAPNMGYVAVSEPSEELAEIDGEPVRAVAPRSAAAIDSYAAPVWQAAAAPTEIPSYGRPGMLAQHAQTWSAEHAQHSADLAFDFVAPEMILAAKVYGLSAGDAAQATRLAALGTGGLISMARAVERTYVAAMAADRASSALTAATPVYDGSVDEQSFSPSMQAEQYVAPRTSARGAVLWPAATVAALGLQAGGIGNSETAAELALPVAALELLAARAVADLGTIVSVGDRATPPAMQFANVQPVDASDESPTAALSEAAPTFAQPFVATESRAASLSPANRERFEALFVALRANPSLLDAAMTSPVAQAARAVALAGRRDGDHAMSARERASLAWSVLPVVHLQNELAERPELAGDFASADGSGAMSEPAGRAQRARNLELPSLRLLDARAETRGGQFDAPTADPRPGLASLSNRAGQALGSYVTTVAADPSASSSYEGNSSSNSNGTSNSSAPRGPTAAPEYVRPAARHGGGDVEIPAWFESAAKKMFAEQQGGSESMSFAELTLVTQAPPATIAASTRATSTPATTSATASASSTPSAASKPDVEGLARDVYDSFLELMDIARWRNHGEP